MVNSPAKLVGANTCQARTVDGAPCKSRISPHEKYCYHHSPGGFRNRVRYLHKNKKVAFWISLVSLPLAVAGTLATFWFGFLTLPQDAQPTVQIAISEWRRHLLPIPPSVTWGKSSRVAVRPSDGAAPESPIMIKMNFKDSPLLSPKRRERITKILDDYYRYLTLNVGFDLTVELPPFGVSPPKSIMLAGGQRDASIYYSHIVVPADGLENPDVLRAAYSTYVFETSLVPTDGGPLVPMNEEASWVFFCYYPSSFSGNTVCAPNAPASKWRSALWEIRAKYGRTYTDELLYYTFKMWSTTPNKQDNFDLFFWNKFAAGETVINNDGDRYNAVAKILRDHGIRLE
jgi:hypothetical protein